LLELALYPSVAPARVLLRHPNDQATDILHHTGTPDSLVGIRPLRSD
jgi:hypothetical protein